MEISTASVVCKGINELSDPHCFVEYMERLVQGKTKRALITIEHFLQLQYLAGRKIAVTKDWLERTGHLVSLRDGDYVDFVNQARRRLDNGEVQSNWLDLFNQIEISV